MEYAFIAAHPGFNAKLFSLPIHARLNHSFVAFQSGIIDASAYKTLYHSKFFFGVPETLDDFVCELYHDSLKLGKPSWLIVPEDSMFKMYGTLVYNENDPASFCHSIVHAVRDHYGLYV